MKEREAVAKACGAAEPGQALARRAAGVGRPKASAIEARRAETPTAARFTRARPAEGRRRTTWRAGSTQTGCCEEDQTREPHTADVPTGYASTTCNLEGWGNWHAAVMAMGQGLWKNRGRGSLCRDRSDSALRCVLAVADEVKVVLIRGS